MSTLYDVMFDEVHPPCFTYYTEDKRCYRLTTLSFLNLSHGIRLKHATNYQNQQQDAVNNVTKFFSAMKSPQRNQYVGPKRLSADSEFQAMWRNLQQPQPPPLQPQPPSFPPAVAEQTNALKKILKISEERHEFSCGLHVVRTCYEELRARYSQSGVFHHYLIEGLEIKAVVKFDGYQVVGDPYWDRESALNSASCLALHKYSRGGPKRRNDFRAGGPANALMEMLKMNTRAMPLAPPKNQWRNSNFVQPQPNFITAQPQNIVVAPPPIPAFGPSRAQLRSDHPLPSWRLNMGQPALPTPPQQWCKQAPPPNVVLPPEVQMKNVRKTANTFVPLQAQMRAKPNAQSSPEKSVGKIEKKIVEPSPQPAPSNSMNQPRRNTARPRSRLAAKFSNVPTN